MCCREQTTLQTQGAVIRMRYYGSSTGRALTANAVRFAPPRRLPDKFQRFQFKIVRYVKMTDA